MYAARPGTGLGVRRTSYLPRWLLAASAVVAAGTASCSSDVTVPDDGSGGAGGGDATASSSATTTVIASSGITASSANSASSAGGSGAGGEGGAEPACSSPNDCPGADEECRSRTCEDGACGVSFVDAGTATRGQLSGDCRRFVCDGEGTEIAIDDDVDILDDELPCTVDSCADGEVFNTPSAIGTACADGVCDGNGACVECTDGAQCATGVCGDEQTCLDPSCVDGVLNGDESDEDCGGSCDPCPDGSNCESGDDCVSGICDGGVCAAPACTDGATNGDETDQDCGGPICSGCGPDASCEVDGDCRGGDCSGSICLASCTDLVTNGDETDQDCGGVDCARCDDGEACVGADDCVSGVCTGDVCQPPACDDGAANGDETDVDCGGPTCDDCADGLGCSDGGDCASGVCQGGVCQVAACDDGLQNGGETGLDCGGGCAGCLVGGDCNGASDCDSLRCDASICAPRLLFSEIRTRGSAGASDELMEIYNPTGEPVTMGPSWTIRVRGASGSGSCTGAENTRFTGAGDVIPPHGHLLLGASAGYDDAVAADRTYASPFVDAANLILREDTSVIDAICFYFDATTLGRLVDPSCNYVCEGAPVSNLPHDNGASGPPGDVDVGLERLPGAALGNGQDTGDNAADFQVVASSPQGLSAAPTP